MGKAIGGSLPLAVGLHPKDMPSYIELAAGFIILTGILFLVSGLFRLGFITQFLPRPVMEGSSSGWPSS